MYVTDDNFDQVMRYLEISTAYAFDLETSGLLPYHGDHICGVAILATSVRDCNEWGDKGDGYDTFYFPVGHEVGFNLDATKQQELKDFFARAISLDKPFVAWNGKFDVTFMQLAGYPDFKQVYDPMLGFHLLDSRLKSYALKTLSAVFYDKSATDEMNELDQLLTLRGFGKGDMWKLEGAQVSEYAEQDVHLTYRMQHTLTPRLIGSNLWDLYLEICEYQLAVQWMESRGLKLDMETLKLRADQSTTKYSDLRDSLSSTFDMPDFNPNSPIQVKKALGITTSTAKEMLLGLGTPEALQIIEARQWSKMNSSYYQPYLRHVTQEGIIHPNFKLHGTETGRLSASNPPMQAVPRKDASGEADFKPKSWVKTVFVAPEGYDMVQTDYRQAEICLGADYANAKAMLSMIDRGVDIHAETAQQVGIERMFAKPLNFSMQYGIGVKALSKDLEISPKKASELIRAYNRVHGELTSLYHDMQSSADKWGHIFFFTGRRYSYSPVIKEHATQAKHNGFSHKASSNLIQGGVGEMARIAITRLWHKFRYEDVHATLQVHDSLMFDIPEGMMEEVIPEIHESMTDFSQEYPHLALYTRDKRKKFRVQFEIDVESGKRWSDLKTYNGETQ